MSKRSLACCLMLIALLVWSAALCFGQATASINGRLTDPQNLVVAGAPVTAKNVDTGIERSTKSTSEGLYHLPSLQPGTYDVSVQAQNFAPAVAKGVHINVGDALDLNFKLQLPGVTTEVVVTGQAPLIETTKTDVSTTVNDSDMEHLPVTNATGGAGGSGMNDFASLAATAPGVRIDLTSVSFDLIGPGAYNDRGNLINVDGGNITDQVVSGRDAVGASLDEIKEFQVITNNYNAEYGQAGGLIINAITKSGTNSIHGDFHFFARGRNLQASSYFYNLGLTQQENPGIGCTTPPCPITGQPRAHFFKHETGFTLGGPIIKNKTFWFVSYEKLLQGAPLTLTPPSGPVTVSQPDDEVMFSVKLDHHLTDKHLITARFNAARLTLDNQLVQIAPVASPDALVSFVNHDHTLNLSLTSTLTPHVVNEARFFWHRYLNGIPTKSELPALAGPNFYEHAAFCCPQGGDQNRYQGIDNMTWVRGAHTLKAGVNFSYFPYFSLFQQVHFGRWKYSGGFPPGAPGSGNAPTAFDFGLGPGQSRAKDNIYGWYVQDTWKLRPNVTLNYGLRWDYEAGAFRGGTIPLNGSFANGCLEGNGIIPACSSDKNNFQPRVGIAWSPRFESGPFRWLFGGPDKSLLSASFAEITQLAYLNISLDSLIFDGANFLTGALPNSICGMSAINAFWPNFPPASALAPCFPPGAFGRVRPISNNLRNPETRHVNVSFQRELSRDLVLNVQYVGAFGFGQFGERDANFPAILEDPAHPGFFYFGARPDSRFTAVRTNENTRTSAYNGLIVDLNKRFSHHFQLHGGYTWSHTISSTEDFFGVSEPADPRTLAGERADAQADIRHMANLGGVFDTEKLSHIRGLRHLINDWQFGIYTQLQGGRPWPISTGDVPFLDALFFGIQNESVQRPTVLPDGTIVTSGIADSFGGPTDPTNLFVSNGLGNYLIGPGAVATCIAAGQPAATCNGMQNTFLAPAGASPLGAVDSYTGDIVDFTQVSGNLKRNAGRTNPFFRTDLSVTRTFRIPFREGTRVELRADFFNLFNRPNFILYGNAPNTSLFTLPPFMVCQVAGCDTSVFSNLMANPAFTSCVACVNPISGRLIGTNGQALTLSDLQHGRVSTDLLNPTFLGMGDPGSTDIPRQIQLSVRVRF